MPYERIPRTTHILSLINSLNDFIDALPDAIREQIVATPSKDSIVLVPQDYIVIGNDISGAITGDYIASPSGHYLYLSGRPEASGTQSCNVYCQLKPPPLLYEWDEYAVSIHSGTMTNRDSDNAIQVSVGNINGDYQVVVPPVSSQHPFTDFTTVISGSSMDFYDSASPLNILIECTMTSGGAVRLGNVEAHFYRTHEDSQ